jgi:polyribonucleotide nucleotidyltransferase
MVEAGAQQVSEAEVLGAIEFGHECCRKIAAAVRELVKVAGKPKFQFTPHVLDQDLYKKIEGSIPPNSPPLSIPGSTPKKRATRW